MIAFNSPLFAETTKDDASQKIITQMGQCEKELLNLQNVQNQETITEGDFTADLEKAADLEKRTRDLQKTKEILLDNLRKNPEQSDALSIEAEKATKEACTVLPS